MNSSQIEQLSLFDWIIFASVITITYIVMIVGVRMKKKELSDTSIIEHLLMGRRLTLPLFIGTLVATWYGGIFGVTAIAFNQGIYNFITQGLFWYLTYIFFALFMVKRIRQTKAMTLPEMVKIQFGPKAAFTSALFNFINVLPITYIISLSFLLKTLFGGELSYYLVISSIIGLTLSTWGGLSAVVFSDFVQFFVMVLSVILVVLFSYFMVGPPSILVKALPASYFSLTGGETLLSTLSWGLIALATLINPAFYQRVFAAKSDKIATRGILISTLIWLIFDICTTLGALYARYKMPDAIPGEAYLRYALHLLPVGLKGFVLAGIFATIVTTLDSYLFIAGNTLSYDLLPKRIWNKYPIIHHLSTFSCAIIATLMAFLFEGNIKLVWKTLGSYFAASLLLPILFGQLFPKKIKDLQFVIITLFSSVVITIYKFSPIKKQLGNLDELYIGISVTGISLGIALVFNHFRKYDET